MEDDLFNIETFDFKKQQLIRLSDLHLMQKEIDRERKMLLYAISDPEKQTKLYSIVDKVHKGILSLDGDLDAVLNDCFQSEPELLEFFLANKHSYFGKSKQIFDDNRDNPVQKKLQRKSLVNKRSLSKQKTPHQHIKHVHDAKQRFVTEARLAAIEKELVLSRLENEARFSFIERGLDEVQNIVQVQSDNILEMLDKLGIPKKNATAYYIKYKNPSITDEEIANMFNVNRRTIQRWFSSIEVEINP